MKKTFFVITMIVITLLFQISLSWSDVISVSRVSNYTINSDASFTYSVDLTYKNTDSINSVTSGGSWNVLYGAATVSTSGYNYFNYNYNDPAWSRTYGFDNWDTAGNPYVTQVYNIKNYLYEYTLGASETKTLHVSYTGPAGVWAEKSSNVIYPWTDQYGYWEFVGDGFSPDAFGTFTVNVTLPSTLDTYTLLGWDVLPTVNGNQFQFTQTNSQEIDMDIVFKTTKPLAAPEPTTVLLLGLGLMGLAGLRRKM